MSNNINATTVVNPKVDVIQFANGNECVVVDGQKELVYERVRESSLMIHDGGVLYIAKLLEDRCDFWTNDVLVYCGVEYFGAEHIERVIGFINGEPVFYGFTCEDGYHYSVDVGKTENCLTFESISETSIRIEHDMPVYAACAYERWYAVIGNRTFGPYTEEPAIVVSSDKADTFQINGTFEGTSYYRSVTVEELLKLEPSRHAGVHAKHARGEIATPSTHAL